jgi:hypothetical protein
MKPIAIQLLSGAKLHRTPYTPSSFSKTVTIPANPEGTSVVTFYRTCFMIRNYVAQSLWQRLADSALRNDTPCQPVVSMKTVTIPANPEGTSVVTIYRTCFIIRNYVVQLLWQRLADSARRDDTPCQPLVSMKAVTIPANPGNAEATFDRGFRWGRKTGAEQVRPPAHVGRSDGVSWGSPLPC